MSFPAMRRLAVAVCFLCPPGLLLAQVSANDVAAISLAADRDFLNAYARVDQGDRAIRDLVTWQRLRFGDAAFVDYLTFDANRGDWPGQDVLRREGEALIPANYDPAAVVGWFAQTKPLTGRGALRLAQAHVALGQRDRMQQVLHEAWLTLGLSDADQAALLGAFGAELADLHAARADAMLWRTRTEDAQRMVPLLSSGQAALVAARIGLIRGVASTDALIAAVPADLRNDPGLLYDRMTALANAGRQTDAMALMRPQSTSAAALGEPFRWSGWRRNLARWQLREGNPQVAYELAANHHMTPAEGAAAYADLEWLAGFVQLRFLNDPARALTHFGNAGAEVDSPISISRAGYWQGRALTALKRDADAAAAHGRAAVHQTAFYGLLSAEVLGQSLDATLSGRDDPRDWQTAPIMRDDMVRAALALLEAGERGKAILFFAELGKRLDAPDLSRLGAALAARGDTYFEVLLGKSAAARGLVVPSVYFPLHPLAEMDLPVSPALALSIARRESEFNVAAGSPVGALGLMQLMPGTASDVARSLSLPYQKARLTTDWRYNVTLGTRYLLDLTERFGNSPVQIAAGYNAGPGRPRDWMAQRGDPRDGSVDVIDWIEMIPFTETRTYVQRVTESLPVYEARLTGEAGPIRFTDLLTGDRSAVRAVARADGALAIPAPVTGPAAEQTPPAATLPRPVSRPSGLVVAAADTPVAASSPVAAEPAAPAATPRVPNPSPVTPSPTAPRNSLRPVARPNVQSSAAN